MSVSRMIKLWVFSTAVACVGIAAPAGAQTIELKLSHFLPPNHTFHKWATAWTEQLNKESNGRVKFQIYPAGQLVGPPNRQFDAARNAIVDIAFSIHGVTPGRYSLTDLTNLPFAWPKAGPSSAIMSRRLTELAPTYLAQEHQGVRILWTALAPPTLFNCRVPVRKLDDFKGLKVRYAGAQNKTLIEALGAVPVLIPPPETQDAISKGIADCATFPHEGALSFDLGTVAKYAVEPGVAAPSFALVMNPAKYQSLAPELRTLIDRTTGVSAAEAYGQSWDAAEKHGREQQIAKRVQILTLSDAELQKLKQIVTPQIDSAIAEVEKQGKPGRKFYEEYTK